MNDDPSRPDTRSDAEQASARPETAEELIGLCERDDLPELHARSCGQALREQKAGLLEAIRFYAWPRTDRSVVAEGGASRCALLRPFDGRRAHEPASGCRVILAPTFLR